MGSTVAIMQPYFLPYAGYFRLISGSDTFVVYDCVQFPRRGWVHRNKLRDRAGVDQWLTLPLAPAPQDIRIDQLTFASGAAADLEDRLRPFDLSAPSSAAGALLAEVRRVEGRPVDYIERLLAQVCAQFDVAFDPVRSSSLELSPTLRGQDRILEICRRLGATRYINAPGGRELYDPDVFAAAGVQLQFLPSFDGPTGSILQRLLDDTPERIRGELYDWSL